MGQRERLGHLKFMQRAKQREEMEKKEKDEAAAINENHWVVPANLKKPGANCVVIVEGDPKPSSESGRMSFQRGGPSLETTNNVAEHSQNLKIKR